jgi:uncharacterized linocin/CFP29 family protein
MIIGRGSAPLADDVWRTLEADVKEALDQHLVGRRVVDFDGPHGLSLAAVNLGFLERKELGPSVQAGLRQSQPLLELRVPFELTRAALDDRARGAPKLADDPALVAARKLAELEDTAIFHALEAAGIRGLAASSSHAHIAVGDDVPSAIDAVTRALLTLDEAAVNGPYAVVLGDSLYRRLAAASEYPPLERLQKLLGERVLHSRIVTGGLVLSERGGDFRLTVGQDAAVGYSSHDGATVALYLLESFTFLVSEPDAVVVLDLT